MYYSKCGIPVTGKTYKVLLDMSYQQWYDKYKSVIGSENIGKTFDDFRK